MLVSLAVVALVIVSAGSFLALGLSQPGPAGPGLLAGSGGEEAAQPAASLSPARSAPDAGDVEVEVPAGSAGSRPAAVMTPTPAPTTRTAQVAGAIASPTTSPTRRPALDPTGGPRSTAAPARLTGWTCDRPVRIEDPTGGRWSVGRISFRAASGYERLVLHLHRSGSGTPGASATAIVLGSSALRSFAPMAPRAVSSRMSVGVDLSDGFRGGLTLRRYRPRGMRLVRDLSVHRDRSGGSKVLASVTSDVCLRLRAPDWRTGTGGSPTRARLLIDVRPS